MTDEPGNAAIGVLALVILTVAWITYCVLADLI